ncbi:MAG: hypothetical protein L7F78_21710, partial [Syntrophales bacterium LBB04]|nr:hypothetical protein [Syntrophales bacterium LBB04]
REGTMRTSNTPARKLCSTVGKIVMALVFVSMISGVAIAPAFGEDNDRGHDQRERGGHGRHGHGRHVYRPPYYSEPVYAPPTVVYAPDPYQSPGISLVVPIHIR